MIAHYLAPWHRVPTFNELFLDYHGAPPFKKIQYEYLNTMNSMAMQQIIGIGQAAAAAADREAHLMAQQNLINSVAREKHVDPTVLKETHLRRIDAGLAPAAGFVAPLPRVEPVEEIPDEPPAD